MTFDVITIFPGFFRGMLEHGLLKRAADSGQITIRFHDLRDFTDDRHRTVDDRPFGGGPGMVFKPEPVFRAVEALRDTDPAGFPVILLSAQGRLLKQPWVEKLAKEPRVALICGRYEGVDERVAQYLATDEISIGDYVLSGGELAAAVVMEAVVRLLPGVLGNEESATQESFAPVEVGGADVQAGHSAGARGGRYRLLDCPHYTRPVDFRGWRVPEVLLSGNHREISRWRRRQALAKTWQNRPDLLEGLALSAEDAAILAELKQATGRHPRTFDG
jgi:tRNA (guanine37-N1)-methyltransferase